MPKQIFMLYSCDDWKTKPCPIVMVTTSEAKLKRGIRTCIEKGDMVYSDGSKENPTVKEQIAMFNRDWKIETRTVINDRLTYGFYDYMYDGELS